MTNDELMQRSIEMSDAIEKIAEALAKAQGEMTSAAKDATNPHFQSRYADLASIWQAIRAPLARHGIAVVQLAEAREKTVAVTTILAHASGQWFRGRLELPTRDLSPQACGSALTYARRYALAAMAGIAPDEDDGEAAMPQRDARPPRREEKKAAPKKEPPPASSQNVDEDNLVKANELRERLHICAQVGTAGELEKIREDLRAAHLPQALLKTLEEPGKAAAAAVKKRDAAAAEQEGDDLRRALDGAAS